MPTFEPFAAVSVPFAVTPAVAGKVAAQLRGWLSRI